MKSILLQFYRQFRWILPLWLVQLLTDWLPDNAVTIRLRGLLMRPFIRRCGRNFLCGRRVTLLNTDRMSIGKHVYIATGAWLNAMGGLTLEDEVVLAPYVVISTSTHGFKDGPVRFGGAHPAPVKIGRGSWLAAHAAVRAGVTVGRGVVVGANGVVTKDTPDNVILGGVPAKVIADRVDNPSDIVSSAEIDWQADIAVGDSAPEPEPNE
jgi:acetyltransferase-like isoleucine patch superfamily enzyme